MMLAVFKDLEKGFENNGATCYVACYLFQNTGRDIWEGYGLIGFTDI